jgi:hypothetical protein
MLQALSVDPNTFPLDGERPGIEVLGKESPLPLSFPVEGKEGKRKAQKTDV